MIATSLQVVVKPPGDEETQVLKCKPCDFFIIRNILWKIDFLLLQYTSVLLILICLNNHDTKKIFS